VTKFPEVFAALAAPFDPSDVKQRAMPGGKTAHYITARTAMNRLDDVLGPENWRDDYHPLENSVICRLTIRLPDGSEVTKCDAGGYAGMSDSGDDDKSGFSDSFKRAAAKWLVGRYLYNDGYPRFTDDGSVPAEARPEPPRPRQEPQQAPRESERPAPGPGAGNGPNPTTGKALFAWAKKQEEQHEGLALVKHLNDWSKLKEFSSTRMIAWEPKEVALGLAEAKRFIKKHAPEAEDDDQSKEPAIDNGPPRTSRQSGNAYGDSKLELAKVQRQKLYKMMKEFSALEVGFKGDYTPEEFDRVANYLASLVPTHAVIPPDKLRSCTDTDSLGMYIDYLDEQIMLLK
jgi:hypothetical protein